MMLTLSSVPSFDLLGQDDQKEMQHDIFGHVMPMASSMVPLHLFSQNNQIEVKH